jgi:hypothetical protein
MPSVPYTAVLSLPLLGYFVDSPLASQAISGFLLSPVDPSVVLI